MNKIKVNGLSKSDQALLKFLHKICQKTGSLSLLIPKKFKEMDSQEFEVVMQHVAQEIPKLPLHEFQQLPLTKDIAVVVFWRNVAKYTAQGYTKTPTENEIIRLAREAFVETLLKN